MTKILYIEDDFPNRMLVRRVLEKAGYTVAEAVDGPSGIKAAEKEQPDLILMDINLPGLNGYETATCIKSLPDLKHIPIIALTANVTESDRKRSLTAGCDGHIAKPFEAERLPLQIAEFLGGRRDKVLGEQATVYLREYNERLARHLEQKVNDLTQANKALSYTDKMKSRFINLAAHEMRTPLTAIHGYLSILTATNSKFLANVDENAMELINGVITGIDRLSGIVQDMLDVTRIEAGTLQLMQTPVNLSMIFRKIQRDFATVINQRQQTLIIADTGHIPTIWADGERVTQILRNLVSNAVKYTPNGGRIEITAAIINSKEQPSQKCVKLTVSDTGIGISPEQQDQIFKVLYEVRKFEHHSSSKTDFMGSGAGLGLPIAQGVALAHGGSLWVESEGNDPKTCPGSKFHLILPFGKAPKD